MPWYLMWKTRYNSLPRECGCGSPCSSSSPAHDSVFPLFYDRMTPDAQKCCPHVAHARPAQPPSTYPPSRWLTRIAFSSACSNDVRICQCLVRGVTFYVLMQNTLIAFSTAAGCSCASRRNVGTWNQVGTQERLPGHRNVSIDAPRDHPLVPPPSILISESISRDCDVCVPSRSLATPSQTRGVEAAS